MKKMQNGLVLELTRKLRTLFGPLALGSIQVNLKEYRSPITEIDLFVSNFVKNKLLEHPKYSKYAFYCEEDFVEYSFPCAILDPIDGTRELALGRPECAVSLALMETPIIDNPSNFAWLYNPFSGFSLDSEIPFVPTFDKSTSKILTFVSRTEFKKGKYNKYLNEAQIDITPRGSIAFKLGLLASGACDFIVSLEPKNVWDIAAGTILCSQRGIHFYENGKRVVALEKSYYEGILIWVPDFLAEAILKVFESEFR